MATVVDTFHGQLDRSSAELGAIQVDIDQTDMIDGERNRLNAIALDIRTRILEIEFDLEIAQLALDVNKMERIGREIVEVFADTSNLRLQLISASED